ncbi:hypothetical protein E3N88_19907 [Mikania micrantha]|uniref:CCHC-type domain-containing protein n=1 Tax=Mikania micrantha TaxID=192012 RepID=A0A5N6NPR7_9ASTR|nr:hypothetical protein E3N88_19907 [Mikania micrantha]
MTIYFNHVSPVDLGTCKTSDFHHEKPSIAKDIQPLFVLDRPPPHQQSDISLHDQLNVLFCINNPQLQTLVTNAVNTAISGILPNLMNQAAQTVIQQMQQHANGGNGPNQGGAGVGAAPAGIHVWLERFQKQKPKSFSTAATLFEAQNWIAHIEKLFEVLGVDNAFKVRLATYKLEDDALGWWKTLKLARGGDQYAVTLPWEEFKELFYRQHFTAADRNEYLREYSAIRQSNEKHITEYKTRFTRLVSFLGTAVGSNEKQVEDFKWGVCDRDRKFILNLQFRDINEVVDAVKILHNDHKDGNKRSDENRKRPRESDRDKSSSQSGKNQSSPPRDRQQRFDRNTNNRSRPWKNRNQNQKDASKQMVTAPIRAQPLNLQQTQQNRDATPPCTSYGKLHKGVCRLAGGLCFRCGNAGHMIKDCPQRDPRADTGKNATKPARGGRVFALTANEAADAPSTTHGPKRCKYGGL